MRASLPKSPPPGAPSVHPVHVRLLCDALRDRGVEVEALLGAAGLRTEPIGGADTRIDLAQLMILIRAARRQCDDPLLPIDWGRRIRPSVHGIAGTAVFSSRSVRQALLTLQAVGGLSSTTLRPTLGEADGVARLTFDEAVPLRELRYFLATATAFMVVQILRNLLGRAIRRVHVEFPFPPPTWAEERRQHCPCEASFDAPVLAITMPAELLDRPCPSADARTHAVAMHQCGLDLLGLSGSLSGRVSALLAARHGDYPTLDEAARALCVSPRSLRRGLRGEGSGYQRLLDRARMAEARRYLEQSSLSVQQITERLGYADPSNFVRAFRRHQGLTPGQHRGQHRAVADGGPVNAPELIHRTRH